MHNKERVVPKEMAFVIIHDTDGGVYLIQQKDCSYWMKPFRHKYNFFGTGLIPKGRETSLMALQRKLMKEVPDAEEKITSEMRFWKTFCLPWGADIDGEYTAHVYVMMMTSKYKMIDLVYAAGGRGEKRGSLASVSTDRIEQMITHKDFMGSLHIVAEEFLKEINGNPIQFFEKLPIKKA
jgi:hypothetical protein